MGLGCCLCALAQAHEGALRVLAQEGSAPKFIEGEPASGHCPDILAAITQADQGLRFDINPQPHPIKRIENGLRAGHVDLACALLDNPQRNALAWRIDTPLYHVQERVVGRRDDPAAVQSWPDLARLQATVLTVTGAEYAAALRQAGVEVVETPGGSVVALHNVANRRARYYYTNALTAAYYLRATGLQADLRILPVVFKTTPIYLWAARHLPETTVRRLERALAQLQRGGELERIHQRYARE
ncbi:MAG: substrate-binding periplasmic protein [Rhodoferax sp.]